MTTAIPPLKNRISTPPASSFAKNSTEIAVTTAPINLNMFVSPIVLLVVMGIVVANMSMLVVAVVATLMGVMVRTCAWTLLNRIT